jgi:hypothetical protein
MVQKSIQKDGPKEYPEGWSRRISIRLALKSIQNVGPGEYPEGWSKRVSRMLVQKSIQNAGPKEYPEGWSRRVYRRLVQNSIQKDGLCPFGIIHERYISVAGAAAETNIKYSTVPLPPLHVQILI